MSTVAKMAGFLGSTSREQLTNILRRWPEPTVSIQVTSDNGRAMAPKVVVVPRSL